MKNPSDSQKNEHSDLFEPDGNGHEPKIKTFLAAEETSETTPQEDEDNTSPFQDDESLKTLFTENALKVLKKRYLKKDRDGNTIETPVQMFRRVARVIASADRLYEPSADIQKTEESFFSIMANLEFMPNSPRTGTAFSLLCPSY